MSSANIAAKEPVAIDVKAGQTYYWCSCGKSATQPFCDGAHQGSEFAPKAFTAEKDETVYLCQCKHTGSSPFCDGAHSKL